MLRTSLNNIEVIPLPNNLSEEEERPSSNVATRAQSIRVKDNSANWAQKMTRRLQKEDVIEEGPKKGKKRRGN